MAWIKRNLYFFIGGIVALGLMAAGGFYLYTQITLEGSLATQIADKYHELQTLITKNPHPGYKDIDNIKAAKTETASIRSYITKTQPYFERIAPIPDVGTNKISNSDFAAALRVTVNELHHSAEQQSVDVPKDYYFTFEAQKKIMIFDSTSLDKLAVQLGEIKAISEILFAARINSLDYIRREIVSTDDKNQSDYLLQKTVSTPLADLTPYEVKFRSFSAELAVVMGTLASSPNGFIVKAINIEPTSGTPEDTSGTGIIPVNNQVPASPMDTRSMRRPGTFIQNQSGIPVQSQPVPQVSHGTQSFLNERPFTVTLLIQVVKTKPLPAK